MSDTAGTNGTEGTDEGAKPAEGTEGTPTIEDLLAEVETLKGHSRKWEDRAKANLEAKNELDALKREKMTDAEKAQADRESLDARISEAEDRAVTAEAALARYKVATEFGLSAEDAEALSSITDETALRALAERLAGRSSTGSVRPNPAQGKRGKVAPATPAEAFADAMSDLF